MNSENDSNQQVDAETPELKEAIQKIKHPPSIDETLRNLPPDELRTNPAVVPEMTIDPGDTR